MKGSPLVLGVGEDEFIIASDATAIVPHTRQVVYLLDGEMVIVTRDRFEIKTTEDEKIERERDDVATGMYIRRAIESYFKYRFCSNSFYVV